MKHLHSVVLVLAAWGMMACGKSSTSPSTTVTVPGIVSVSGQVELIAAPVDARLDALQSDTRVRVFNEVQAVSLASPLTVDVNAPGTFTVEPTPPLPTIPAGTPVNSYYFVADPVTPSGGAIYAGSITFDRNVLGIIALTPEFAASNAVLGHPGTSYSSAGLQFEFSSQEDRFTLSSDRRTLTFNIIAFNAADNLRIITER